MVSDDLHDQLRDYIRGQLSSSEAEKIRLLIETNPDVQQEYFFIKSIIHGVAKLDKDIFFEKVKKLDKKLNKETFFDKIIYFLLAKKRLFLVLGIATFSVFLFIKTVISPKENPDTIELTEITSTAINENPKLTEFDSTRIENIKNTETKIKESKKNTVSSAEQDAIQEPSKKTEKKTNTSNPTEAKKGTLKSVDIKEEGKASYVKRSTDSENLNYGFLYSWDAAKQVCPSLFRIEQLDNIINENGGINAPNKRDDLPTYNNLEKAGYEFEFGGMANKEKDISGLKREGYYWSSTSFNKKFAWGYYFYKEGNQVLIKKIKLNKDKHYSCLCID